jgi:hypothetical protein
VNVRDNGWHSDRVRRDDFEVLSGYVSGPAAATEATAVALAKAAGARAVVLVEGISDQIAVETVAARRGLDLGADGVVVVPTGGAHGFARYARRFGPRGAGVRLAGLCDAAEEGVVRRGLAAAGGGSPRTRADLERAGFHVCEADLEEELIRAAGSALVEELFAAHGDLGAFRTMQRQPAWRGRPEEEQARRFLGAGSRRKLRYARLLADAIDLRHLPKPLGAVLADIQLPACGQAAARA